MGFLQKCDHVSVDHLLVLHMLRTPIADVECTTQSSGLISFSILIDSGNASQAPS